MKRELSPNTIKIASYICLAAGILNLYMAIFTNITGSVRFTTFFGAITVLGFASFNLFRLASKVKLAQICFYTFFLSCILLIIALLNQFFNFFGN